MDKKTTQLEELKKNNPFKVPEGYFENLTDQIMTQLPEKEAATPQVVSLWGRVKPWLYAAAMIAGVAVLAKSFISSPDQTKKNLNLTSSADIEAFYQYYEDELTNSLYHDAFYLDEEYFSNDYE